MPGFLDKLKAAIRNQTSTVNEQLLDRVKKNFWERLKMRVCENSSHLVDVIFQKEKNVIFVYNGIMLPSLL